MTHGVCVHGRFDRHPGQGRRSRPPSRGPAQEERAGSAHAASRVSRDLAPPGSRIRRSAAPRWSGMTAEGFGAPPPPSWGRWPAQPAGGGRRASAAVRRRRLPSRRPPSADAAGGPPRTADAVRPSRGGGWAPCRRYSPLPQPKAHSPLPTAARRRRGHDPAHHTRHPARLALRRGAVQSRKRRTFRGSGSRGAWRRVTGSGSGANAVSTSCSSPDANRSATW